MLKTIALAALALFTVPCFCLGQIGAAKAELEEHYGKSIPSDKLLNAEFDKEVDDCRTFHHKDLRIHAGFKDGKAVLFIIQKEDKSPMTKDEVFSILEIATPKHDWILVSDRDLNPRWKLGDSSIFAYYYSEPAYDGDPGRYVRIQTSRLEAISAANRTHALPEANSPTQSAAPTIIEPDDKTTPLFEVFEVTWNEKKASFDGNKPLLVVSNVRDLVLAKDQKGVLIRLNENDTKVFASLSHKNDRGHLLLKATDNVMEIMHITAPIEDGYLGFKHPQEGAVAEYLRQRFHLAEFK